LTNRYVVIALPAEIARGNRAQTAAQLTGLNRWRQPADTVHDRLPGTHEIIDRILRRKLHKDSLEPGGVRDDVEVSDNRDGDAKDSIQATNVRDASRATNCRKVHVKVELVLQGLPNSLVDKSVSVTFDYDNGLSEYPIQDRFCSHRRPCERILKNFGWDEMGSEPALIASHPNDLHVQ
jgi:hypothetical protein